MYIKQQRNDVFPWNVKIGKTSVNPFGKPESSMSILNVCIIFPLRHLPWAYEIDYQQHSLGVLLNLGVSFCVQECCNCEEWGKVIEYKCIRSDSEINGYGPKFGTLLSFILPMLLEEWNTDLASRIKCFPSHEVNGWRWHINSNSEV